MDCLLGMKYLSDRSVDMILCDLPYGTTRNTWDSVIPLESLWIHYERVIKDNGAIILTAQTPFDKVLGMSNLNLLRYEWIWHKVSATGHLNAKKMPMKAHENILVFYKKMPTYNAQKTTGHKSIHSYTNRTGGNNYGSVKETSGGGDTDRYPRSVLTFPTDKQKEYLHPTQKPLELFRYLIRTYTNPNEIILDNCMGSGTTAVAALQEKRNFIGFEIESDYCDIANRRIENMAHTLF